MIMRGVMRARVNVVCDGGPKSFERRRVSVGVSVGVSVSVVVVVGVV